MNKFLFLSLTILISVFTVQKTSITLAKTSNNLVSEAQELYQQSQYTEAIKLLEIAIQDYQQKEDFVGLAIAYRNLALVYQKLGQWQQALDTLTKAENIIKTIEDNAKRYQLLATILEVRGQIELSLGRSQNALSIWKRTTSLYEQQDNITGYTQAKIYQASALQTMGLYSQAIKNLTEVKDNLANKPDNEIKAQALIKLGNVLTRIGKYESSQNILESSLTIAKDLNNEFLIAESLFNLGNNARLKAELEKAKIFYDKAIEKDILEKAKIYYNEAIATYENSDLRLRANLEILGILITLEDIQAANKKIIEIDKILDAFPPQQVSLQGKLNLIHYLIKLERQSNTILPILLDVIKQAKALNIQRIESEALGVLGNLYEKNQQWSEAEKITKQALITSQTINARELSYQWQWQLGRIFQAKNKTELAKLAYTQATDNLQTLRSDLTAISSDVQYSFREKIEPVYREFVALLLSSEKTQTNLEQAREVIEFLQIAELDNFFRDACLDTQPVQVDHIDPNAAIFYTIIIQNRLEVIAALPNQPLKHYSNDLPPSEIEIVVTSANSQINNRRRPNWRRVNLKLLQQIYDWLIRPVEQDLVSSKINTLVFISDGILRNLPPATLHDGKQYLIEKYSIAIAPSLRLTQLETKKETRQDALLAGLSESRQGFSSLPGVEQEIAQIKPLFTSEVLLNESFTEINFNRSTNETPYRIVHLATHGQFSSNAEETFLLTWDGRINIEELNSLIRGDSKQLRPVDLLVLSACETASGDRDSALGLAGIAVRGGARSTLASLWAVSDKATVELMTNFYQELAKKNTTKAEALRQAQISLLKSDQYAHPFFWSAFILVGNWQ